MLKPVAGCYRLLFVFKRFRMDQIDFGSILILSACGTNETFFLRWSSLNKFRKIYLTFHMWNELTFLWNELTVLWNDLTMERNDRLSSCALSSLPMNKLKSLLQKTRKVMLFVWKSIWKNTPLSSEIHCYVKNRKGLHLNRNRSNCNNEVFT